MLKLFLLLHISFILGVEVGQPTPIQYKKLFSNWPKICLKGDSWSCQVDNQY